MATIAENLQILKDSCDAIELAIIDNGGTVTGGLSSYADAINALFLITFTIDSVEYQARAGMTWEDWVNSEYNTGGFCFGKYSVDLIYTSDLRNVIIGATRNANIIADYSYKLEPEGDRPDE